MDDGPEVSKGRDLPPPLAAAEKEAAAARAADPNMELIDGVVDAAPPLGRDRAAGRPQRGIPSDPNPIALSGLSAREIAEIAYNAVQAYKEVIDQSPVWYCDRPLRDQAQIQETVAKVLRGEVLGAAAMHEIWKENTVGDREVPAAIEEDPRLGQAWLEMDPSESRKGLIFQVVLTALVRPF
jgi:hypothetical protein